MSFLSTPPKWGVFFCLHLEKSKEEFLELAFSLVSEIVVGHTKKNS
jgi:hypothetical protein